MKIQTPITEIMIKDILKDLVGESFVDYTYPNVKLHLEHPLVKMKLSEAIKAHKLKNSLNIERQEGEVSAVYKIYLSALFGGERQRFLE